MPNRRAGREPAAVPCAGIPVLLTAGGSLWPEFLEFPSWAAGADLMFAEAAGWARPIRFAKGTGDRGL